MDYLKNIQKLNRNLVQYVKGAHYLLPVLNQVLLPKINAGVEIETIYGFFIYINPHKDDSIEKVIYERGIYEYGTLHIIDLFLKEKDKFIDVGANIGLMSLLAAQKVQKKGEVHSFEVNPAIFSQLEHNLKINNFGFVKAHYCALGSYSGVGDLSESEFNKNRGGSTMLEIIDREEKKYQVPVNTLDNLFSGDYDMIKIDVEGWELEVLKGGNRFFSQENAPAIIIECSMDRVNKVDERKKIYEKIKELNSYRIFKLKNKKERKGRLVEIRNISELPVHDNIFCFKEKHLSRFSPGFYE